MKIIFLGKDKPIVYKALDYLSKKVEIVAVVGLSKKIRYPLITEDQLYKKKFKDIDLVISYLYPRIIKSLLIKLPKNGCINFHPAPLPNFRGVCGYSFGIFNSLKIWGVTAHFVDKTIDTGDIIKTKKFLMNPKNETALSLEKKTQLVLFNLFKEIINMILNKKILPRTPQKKGLYFSKKAFEKMRKIEKADDLETINKKIRACWFPPHPGAFIELKNHKFTIINEEILKSIK